uniref:Leucine-rich repeat-containing N-terminal plant-type domain-containing protein n=1 Tax=Brassica campestris TaxID=3711 RepID=A0A3P6CE10_BRACM|nr:unnamed protein product [Brassica rapa]
MTLRLRVDSISRFFCCVFSLSFLVTTLVSQPFRRPDQVETLLAFKNEFSICNNSTTSSWSEDAVSFDGVVFDDDTGAVTDLHLGAACLSGNLKANSSLYRFQHLRYLDLSSNDFSSSFPAEFGRLTSLEVLDLHHNRFTGEVPSSISNLSRLTSLDLSVNKLTGVLGNNIFSGGILEPISNLVNLIYLDLSFLNITFPVNFTFLKLQSLENLDISGNSVSRLNISSENAFPTMLIELHLSSCNIHEFPKVLKTLQNLQHLDISNNSLKGKVPAWLWNLPSLTSVRLSHNSINGGAVPGCLSESLQVLNLSNNNLVGELPDIFYGSGSLTTILETYTFIDFSGNRLGGHIPKSIGLLKSLIVLDLSNNNFTGHIPSSLASLTQLESLDLSRNQLSGIIPQELRTTKPNHTYQFSIFSCVSNLFFPMMKVHLPVFSMTSLFWCVFVSIFLVNTLVSVPFPLPNQIEILLAFKKEFLSPTCSPTVLSSWTKNTRSFDGVVFDNEAGVVTELHLSEACLKGTIKNNSNLFKFHHLRYLDLSYNHFEDSFPSEFGNHFEEYSFPSEFGGLANLEFLNFRYSGLVGEVPLSIHNLSRLTFLDLSQNDLTGGFPLIYNLSKLSYLNLSYNNFIGTIPSSLLTMPSLLNLDLRQNDLSFLNMIYPINIVFLPLKSLEYLDLSGNTLSRLNTSSTDHALPKLVELKLSYCNIFEFPKFLMTLQSLEYLDLSWNNLLKGKVPAWLWTLPVTRLSLYHNSLNGFEGSREVLLNSSLEMLDLASNTFGGPFPILPPTIDYVVASNNNFTGELPLSLCSPRKLSLLDLSSNNFSGPIPGCLGDSINGEMNLHKNNLNGKLPDELCRSGSLITIDVGHNQISGKLPRSLVNCKSLEVLNVESNQINETFPFWLKILNTFAAVDFSVNRFGGEIPESVGLLTSLLLLNLSNNGFTGHIPSSMGNLSNLESLDIRRNQLSGTIPQGLAREIPLSLCNPRNLLVLELSNNSLTGAVPRCLSESITVLEYGRPRVKLLNTYGHIDFSGNRFGGEIPESIGLLKSLLALNLSNNGFTGHIPSSLANLTELESLDISSNQLSGTIPQELGKLSFLSYINMSYNKLTGEIPQGTQFQTQNESAFEGNIDLCGFPLQKSCSMANVSSHASKPMHNLNSRKPLLLFSFLIVFHFVLSFSIPLSTSL